MRKIGVIVGEKIGLKNFSNIDLVGMTETDEVGEGLDQEALQEKLTWEIDWVTEVILGEQRDKIENAFK